MESKPKCGYKGLIYTCEADDDGVVGEVEDWFQPIPGNDGTEPNCVLVMAIPQPQPGTAIWEGNSPEDGAIMVNNCVNDPETWLFYRFADPVDPEPPVDPGDLAIQAIKELKLPAPALNVGPDDGQLAVNVWMWLWVDEQPPVSITVTAGTVSVTATATLASVTWTSDEPVRDSALWAEPAGTPVVCSGTGSPPVAGYPAGERPPCGYVFRSRSTEERTGGAGTWTLTATAAWEVEWASNTGVSGSDELASTGARQVAIGEWDTELVSGGN